MNANKPEWPPVGSDMAKIDAHEIQPEEYDELPELTDEMLARGVVSYGGYDGSAPTHQLISLYLTVEVIKRWEASGPDWRIRMADRLSQVS